MSNGGNEATLNKNFLTMAAFALVITSIAVFFGSIIYSMQHAKDFVAAGVEVKDAIGFSSDFMLKGILTAIFTLLFAVVFMLNNLMHVLERALVKK